MRRDAILFDDSASCDSIAINNNRVDKFVGGSGIEAILKSATRSGRAVLPMLMLRFACFLFFSLDDFRESNRQTPRRRFKRMPPRRE